MTQQADWKAEREAIRAEMDRETAKPILEGRSASWNTVRRLLAKSEEDEREIQGVLDSIPAAFRIVSRPSAGAENIYESLAISVAKMSAELVSLRKANEELNEMVSLAARSDPCPNCQTQLTQKHCCGCEGCDCREEAQDEVWKSAVGIAFAMAAGETAETGRQKAMNIAAALEAARQSREDEGK